MVDANFDVRARAGDEWMVLCPFHNNVGTPSLQINVQSGLFGCFNPECGARGGPKKLTAYCHERFTDDEVDVSEITRRLNLLTQQSGEQPTKVLNESLVSRFNFPTDYWDKRGFTKITQAAFDLGFDPINNHAIIALRNLEGALVGFLRRDLNHDAVVKYRNPKHYKKAHELFASWMAYRCASDVVVICEGPVDAIKVWQAGFCAVAQYGAQISPEQVRLLRRMGFGRVVLFYDHDAAGERADAAARGLKHHLQNNHVVTQYDSSLDLTRDFLVSRAHYGSCRAKDPGAMNDEEVAIAVVGATPVM